MSSLNQLLLDVHQAFNEKGLDHAFGGALALMHYVADPRLTRDIDVNLFVKESEVESAAVSLASRRDNSSSLKGTSRQRIRKTYLRFVSH